MRLYEKVGEQEITDVNFHTVQKTEGVGGKLACTVEDDYLENIATYEKYGLLPLEVRKNDGSTVLWEGLLTNIRANNQGYILTGDEILSILKNTAANYVYLLPAGAITEVGADYIVDANAAFSSAAINGLFCGISRGGTSEVVQAEYLPDAASFLSDNGGDDPADVETGAFGDIDDGYMDTTMEISNLTNIGDEQYGLIVEFTVADASDIKYLYITLVGWVGDVKNPTGTPLPANFAYVGGSEPNLYIYNDDDTAYTATDVANEIQGLGRQSTVQYGINGFVIEIVDNIEDYIDGSNKVKIKLMDGLPADTAKMFNRIELCTARIFVEKTVKSAGLSENYTIDAVTTTKLTFTGETPATDGVAINDSYFVQKEMSVIMAAIWRQTPVPYCSLTMAASSGYDNQNRNGSPITSILNDYAKRLDRYVFQSVGWVINNSASGSLVDTTYNLTEGDFLSWLLDLDFQRIRTNTHISGADRKLRTFSAIKSGRYSGSCDITPAMIFPEGIINSSASAILARTQQLPLVFRGRMDLDEGSYGNIDLCKTADLNLYSGKKTFTAGILTNISYSQPEGDNLMADVEIETYESI